MIVWSTSNTARRGTVSSSPRARRQAASSSKNPGKVIPATPAFVTVTGRSRRARRPRRHRDAVVAGAVYRPPRRRRGWTTSPSGSSSAWPPRSPITRAITAIRSVSFSRACGTLVRRSGVGAGRAQHRERGKRVGHRVQVDLAAGEAGWFAPGRDREALSATPRGIRAARGRAPTSRSPWLSSMSSPRARAGSGHRRGGEEEGRRREVGRHAPVEPAVAAPPGTAEPSPSRRARRRSPWPASQLSVSST